MSLYPEWVLDTNVIVSGLLSAEAPPGRILDALLDRRLKLAYDDRIEAEYRDVLARPKFRIDRIRLGAFLAVLQYQTHLHAASIHGLDASDPDDTKFLEVAAASRDRVLVSGNLRHFPQSGRKSVTVLAPAQAERLLYQT